MANLIHPSFKITDNGQYSSLVIVVNRENPTNQLFITHSAGVGTKAYPIWNKTKQYLLVHLGGFRGPYNSWHRCMHRWVRECRHWDRQLQQWMWISKDPSARAADWLHRVIRCSPDAVHWAAVGTRGPLIDNTEAWRLIRDQFPQWPR